MTKEFIPYEQALELKELGFNESCIGYYRQGEVSIVFAGNYLSELELEKNFEEDGDPLFGDKGCTAPLYQQAFRWFREKYDFRYSIGATNICVYHIPVKNYHTTFMIQDCKSYEEAELECIKSFILIAKNK